MSGPLPYPPFFGWSQIVSESKPVGHARTEPEFWELLVDVEEQTHDLETGLPYPEPSTARPRDDELWAWLFDGACPATDGCEVEPDGTCPHGHPAWPRRMGLV